MKATQWRVRLLNNNDDAVLAGGLRIRPGEWTYIAREQRSSIAQRFELERDDLFLVQYLERGMWKLKMPRHSRVEERVNQRAEELREDGLASRIEEVSPARAAPPRDPLYAVRETYITAWQSHSDRRPTQIEVALAFSRSDTTLRKLLRAHGYGCWEEFANSIADLQRST